MRQSCEFGRIGKMSASRACLLLLLVSSLVIHSISTQSASEWWCEPSVTAACLVQSRRIINSSFTSTRSLLITSTGSLECETSTCRISIRSAGTIEINGTLHGQEVELFGENIHLYMRGSILASTANLTARNSLVISRRAYVSASGKADENTSALEPDNQTPYTCGFGGTHGGEGSECCSYTTEPNAASGSLHRPWTHGGSGGDALLCEESGVEDYSDNQTMFPSLFNDSGCEGTLHLAKGGRGGGRIFLQGGLRLEIDGNVSANGASGSHDCQASQCFASGGGAGGSIQLVAPKIEGNGLVQANGGVGGRPPDTTDEAEYGDFYLEFT
jgi:hypothetical protein